MRVLGAGKGVRLLLTTDAIGGVWRYAMELAAGLRALGGSVLVVSMGPPPSPAQRYEAGEGLEVSDLALDWLAGSPEELENAARSLATMAYDWGASGIHLHMPALASLAAWPAPVIATAHSCVGTWWRAVRTGPLPFDLAWRAALVRDGLEAADVVTAPSRSFAHALAEEYHLKRSVLPVLNGRRPLNGTSLPRWGALTVGRLWDEGKNIGTLDQAAARTPGLVRAVGPTRGANGAAVKLRHIRELGSFDELALADIYAAAEVFVSVALYEPFGLSVLEAAQAGCPLVLSDIPSFRELWDGAAVFVDPRDPDAIVRGIAAARTDAGTLGAAANRRAARYTREAMARDTLALHRVTEVA